MWSRLYFPVACAFFLVMNGLLFWSVVGGKDFAVPIPVDTVVRHVFESADASTLEIRHHGTKIGYFRWGPTPLTHHTPGDTLDTNQVLEGMVTGITGYEVDLDGSVTVGQDQRLRFDVTFEVDTNFTWTRFQGRVQSRPWRWETLALASARTVELSISRDDESRRHEFTFEDFQNPSQILSAMAGPLLAHSLELFGLASDPFQQARELSIGLEWTAHTDRQKIGNTSLAVYRLQSRIFDDYRITLYFLQSGEILRVELPDNIVLVNDELTSM